MKFIVDAHLPVKLVKWLNDKGFNAIHTTNLPNQNFTDDIIIIKLSVNEKRIVISKDKDFLEYFLLKGEPYKLLIITTGNIVNKELIKLFEKNFEALKNYFKTGKVVELSNKAITVLF